MSDVSGASSDNVSEFGSYTDMTREFYRAFKQYMPPVGTKASLDESVISEERLHLKVALIAEEFSEFIEAVYGAKAAAEIRGAFNRAVKLDNYNRDIVETADATADLRVVLDGFDIEAAIPTEKVLSEVFRSNMSKLDENGNPILSDGSTAPLGKILKSKLYTPPNIKGVLE